MDIEELEKYVCESLKRERERLGMSQLALSYESEVSQNMITYIETGKRTPSLHTILKLCDAMNISPAILFPQDISVSKEQAKKLIIELVDKYM